LIETGAIAFPWLVVNVDSDKFCDDVNQKKGVLLLPGYGFIHFHLTTIAAPAMTMATSTFELASEGRAFPLH
jgi:hypothetical protein